MIKLDSLFKKKKNTYLECLNLLLITGIPKLVTSYNLIHFSDFKNK